MSFIDMRNTGGKTDFVNFGEIEFEALGGYLGGVVQHVICYGVWNTG